MGPACLQRSCSVTTEELLAVLQRHISELVYSLPCLHILAWIYILRTQVSSVPAYIHHSAAILELPISIMTNIQSILCSATLNCCQARPCSAPPSLSGPRTKQLEALSVNITVFHLKSVQIQLSCHPGTGGGAATGMEPATHVASGAVIMPAIPPALPASTMTQISAYASPSKTARTPEQSWMFHTSSLRLCSSGSC